jgi:dolichol kinase
MTGTPDSSLFLEFKRKAIHLLALIIPFGLYFFPVKPALILLFSVTAAFLAVETLRLRFIPVNTLFLKCFSPLLRSREQRMLTGATTLLISASFCTLIMLSFQKELLLPREARAALFYSFSFLIAGDSTAAIFGKLYGKQKLFGEKTVIGSLACLLTGLFIYAAAEVPLHSGVTLPAALLTALLTALLEALPLKFDDNLFVPPVTCLTLFLIQKTDAFG